MISGESGVKDVIGGNRYIKIGSKEIEDKSLKEMIHSFPLRLYNVTTHLNLESVLMPIGDGMTVSKVKQ